MRTRKSGDEVWVAVKIERGFVSEARLFESLRKAEQTERRWRKALNLDYDETGVVSAGLSTSLRARPKSAKGRS